MQALFSLFLKNFYFSPEKQAQAPTLIKKKRTLFTLITKSPLTLIKRKENIPHPKKFCAGPLLDPFIQSSRLQNHTSPLLSLKSPPSRISRPSSLKHTHLITPSFSHPTIRNAWKPRLHASHRNKLIAFHPNSEIIPPLKGSVQVHCWTCLSNPPDYKTIPHPFYP